MGLISSIGISRSALQAQRLRMDVTANNLANMNSTRTPEGGPYKRQTVLLSATPGDASFSSVLSAQNGSVPGGVSVTGVVEDAPPPRRVYEPTNPDAGPDGFVLYPDIDVSLEMTDLMSANRSYQANVTALNAAKNMAQKALEIGR
jgi:flagellar basal-body rod protein FlgC